MASDSPAYETLLIDELTYQFTTQSGNTYKAYFLSYAFYFSNYPDIASQLQASERLVRVRFSHQSYIHHCTTLFAQLELANACGMALKAKPIFLSSLSVNFSFAIVEQFPNSAMKLIVY